MGAQGRVIFAPSGPATPCATARGRQRWKGNILCDCTVNRLIRPSPTARNEQLQPQQ
ncbi:hypothetical protein CSC33_3090 [Pseudomonas aeruginosa]|nr:hypothetical protein CSC33_3090 [Pseudomonas aeruginosa]